jgi:hypothetical protein
VSVLVAPIADVPSAPHQVFPKVDLGGDFTALLIGQKANAGRAVLSLRLIPNLAR